MSSRQRRLAAKQNEILWANVVPETESSDGASSDEDLLQSATNPYEILQPPQEEVTVETEDEEVDEPVEAETKMDHGETEMQSTAKNDRRKKKKNKKKDRRTKVDESNHKDQKNMTVSTSKSVPEKATISETPERSIFALSFKSLRGDEELNRIFGARVVANVEAEIRKSDRRNSRRQTAGTNRHGTRRFIRRFLLTDPRPDWISRESSIEMVSKEKLSDGGEIFAYVPTDGYQAVHEKFLDCQDLADPHVLGAFLMRFPFHVEALLAMHDVLMTTGSHLEAEECLNRALFCLESVWHRTFIPALGRCRLDYKVDLNQLLFTALFSHMQHLNKRGCLKTAFECCKFLLGLDQTDPFGTLCTIDYFAIRAGRFKFLEELMVALPEGPSFSIRPGISFSLAYCRQRQGNAEEAMQSLVQAILMHPLVIVRLMNKLKQINVKLSSDWESRLGERFFARASEDGSASYGHLVNLFVERHHLLYKTPEMLEWIYRGASQALDCWTLGKAFQGVTAEDWSCVRCTAFPSDSTNYFRHLHLYNFSDDISRVPEELLQGGGGGGMEEMELFERRMADQIERRGESIGGVRLTEDELRNGNPLILFLRSLLPWVQAENRDNQRQNQE